METPEKPPSATVEIPLGISSSGSDSSSATKSLWQMVQSDKHPVASNKVSDVKVINGVAKAAIPPELLENSQPLWTNYIIGYFIGDAPHIGKVHATINRLWSTPDRALKIDAQFLNPKAVLFRIENGQVRSRVLRRQFWHIADVPVVVNEWNPRNSSLKPDLSSMPIWVDLKNVPDYLFSNPGLMFLGNIVGDAQKLHPNTEGVFGWMWRVFWWL